MTLITKLCVGVRVCASLSLVNLGIQTHKSTVIGVGISPKKAMAAIFECSPSSLPSFFLTQKRENLRRDFCVTQKLRPLFCVKLSLYS